MTIHVYMLCIVINYLTEEINKMKMKSCAKQRDGEKGMEISNEK